MGLFEQMFGKTRVTPRDNSDSVYRAIEEQERRKAEQEYERAEHIRKVEEARAKGRAKAKTPQQRGAGFGSALISGAGKVIKGAQNLRANAIKLDEQYGISPYATKNQPRKKGKAKKGRVNRNKPQYQRSPFDF